MSENLEFTSYVVGQEFPHFTENFEEVRGQVAGRFEALENDAGYLLCVYVPHVNYSDHNSFNHPRVNLRLYQGPDYLVLPIIQFGGGLSLELNFDPSIYPDDRALQLTRNNLLMMALIDSNNNIVKSLRSSNLPLKFIQLCRRAWSEAILDINCSSRFRDWHAQLRRQDPRTLWKNARTVGHLGERFNIQDIFSNERD